MHAVITLNMLGTLQEQMFSAIVQSVYSKCTSMHSHKQKHLFIRIFSLAIIKSDIWNVEALYKPSSKIVSAYCCFLKNCKIRHPNRANLELENNANDATKEYVDCGGNALLTTSCSAQKVEPPPGVVSTHLISFPIAK